MKKKNGLFYALGALAVLCIIYLGVSHYMDRSQKKKQQQEEESEVNMTDFSSVTAVSFDVKGKNLSFTKKDETWKYDDDDLFPVKQMKLDSLASTVKKLSALRKLEGGDSISSYGLDQPSRKVTVTSEDGKKTTILIGNKANDNDYYAMIEGEDTPYLISASLYGDTDEELDQFMELEKLPAIAGTDIQTITVKKADTSKHYVKKKVDEKKDTIEWYKDSADKPENKLSDNSELNVLADSLSGLTVKSCANYKVKDRELTKYGLDNPTAVLTYTYEKDGKNETFTLSVGALTDDKSCYYTRTKDSSNVNEIEKASIDKCLHVQEESQKDQ